MTAKRLGYAVALLVMLSSGLYVFVYLYRWEWNRAIVAGVFLIASGVALATMAILDRIARLEERLDATLQASPAALASIQAARPEAHSHFAWLVDTENTNVFVPVLMGAGVVVSALAWAVERLALTTMRPSMERSLATNLGALSLPPGGLLGKPQPAVARHAVAPWKSMTALVVAVALLWGGIDLLGDMTQGRPDLHASGAASEILLDVSADDGDLTSEVMAARGLWGACRSTLNKRLESAPVIDATGSMVRIFLRPGLGEHSKRRLVGCLEDSLIDHVQGRVVSIRNFN
ncbi:MAG TPA: hypothetical protein VJ927_12665 [Actinomycetota bacterium]|nr:hypothetical protein [Actinomycetota bacterium]